MKNLKRNPKLKKANRQMSRLERKSHISPFDSSNFQIQKEDKETKVEKKWKAAIKRRAKLAKEKNKKK